MVNVFAFFWKTPRLLKLKKTISFFRGRTRIGRTWSTAKKFLILNLSSLHPYGKLCLGYAARLWFVLLGNSTCCSATAHNCSATHHGGRTMSLTARLCSHLLGQAQDDIAQRVQGVRGLAMGDMTPDTHRRPHGLRPQGWPSPQDESLRDTTLLGPSRKAREDILKILRDLLGYV